MLLKSIKILILWMSLVAAQEPPDLCMDDSDCGPGKICPRVAGRCCRDTGEFFEGDPVIDCDGVVCTDNSVCTGDYFQCENQGIPGLCSRKTCAANSHEVCEAACAFTCDDVAERLGGRAPARCVQKCRPCCIAVSPSQLTDGANLCSHRQCKKWLDDVVDPLLAVMAGDQPDGPSPPFCIDGVDAPNPADLCKDKCEEICTGTVEDAKCEETCFPCCQGGLFFQGGCLVDAIPQCQKFLEEFPDLIPLVCFSGHSTVNLQGKGETRMDQLQVGDAVLTSKGYAKVYSFGHLDRNGKTPYLQIQTTANDAPLEISKDHLLYVFDEAKQMQSIVPARDIKVGNLLISEPGTQVEVQSIRQVTRHGAYAPFTTTGDIVVNGVVASNYIAFPPAFHDHLSFKQQHWVQHAALHPIRAFCGVLGCENETYDKATGYSKPVSLWMLILHWAQKIDSSVFMSGFLYLFALPTLWLFLNMTHLVAALLGYYVWKKMTNMKVAAIIEKKPTKCTLLN